MAFPWDSLIAASAGVVGGLGGAGITGYLANKREGAAADRTEDAAEAGRQREAYASVIVTSRAALRNFRQLRLAYAAGAPDIPEVTEAITQASTLVVDMNQASAVAELLGSEEARRHARDIYEKAKACAYFYQARSMALAGLEKIRGKPHPAAALFDADEPARLCDDLDAAIDAFADTAREEISGVAFVASPRTDPS
jgi:hypothetical protein